MYHDYQNVISHVDIDRSLDAIEYSSFYGIDDPIAAEFQNDFEANNDTIELHLIKSNAYKEALILHLKKSNGDHSAAWRELLNEEQKTFGGSKMFYINNDCSRLLILSLPDEMRNKINMTVTRINKINDKISRINAKIRKENRDLYEARLKSKESVDKRKEDIINFINQNLRV